MPNPTSLDFQTAPYEALCGCVSALIPPSLDHIWANGNVNQKATRNLIKGAKGNRIVDADCPKCYGTGLVPPKVVCLSGSTRFIDVMAVKAWEMERDGRVVTLGCHLLPKWYGAAEHHQAEVEGSADHMDEIHRCKIDMADELFVVNVDGYIGESTRAEIQYAKEQGKPISYLESEVGEGR